jgi:hypothetical protein
MIDNYFDCNQTKSKSAVNELNQCIVIVNECEILDDITDWHSYKSGSAYGYANNQTIRRRRKKATTDKVLGTTVAGCVRPDGPTGGGDNDQTARLLLLFR